jgi:hypothetical protein
VTTYTGDFVCSKCGGKHIQCKAWVDANTGEFKDWDACDSNEAWCDDCEEHIQIVEEVAA